MAGRARASAKPSAEPGSSRPRCFCNWPYYYTIVIKTAITDYFFMGLAGAIFAGTAAASGDTAPPCLV